MEINFNPTKRGTGKSFSRQKFPPFKRGGRGAKKVLTRDFHILSSALLVINDQSLISFLRSLYHIKLYIV